MEETEEDDYEKIILKYNFRTVEELKIALNKSYDEYAKECSYDYELFKRKVAFKRDFDRKGHYRHLRRVRNSIKKIFTEKKKTRINKPRYNTEESKYKAYDGHPLTGRYEFQSHPYDIECGIELPKRIEDHGLGTSIKEKRVWPFHFMEVGQSIFVPKASRYCLMKAATNWSYSYRHNMYEEDENGDYVKVRRKFLVSEVYENGSFVGSRIWLVKKEKLYV